MNCKFCGKKISKTSRYCSSCGAKVEEINETEHNNQYNGMPNNNKVEQKLNIPSTTGLLTSAIIATVLSLLSFNFLALIFGIIAIVYLCTYKNECVDEIKLKQINNGKVFSIITWAIFGVGVIIRIIIAFLVLIPALIVSTTYDYEDYKWNDNYYEHYYNHHEYYDDYTYEYGNLIEIDYDEFLELYRGKSNSIVLIAKPNCNMYKSILDDIAFYNDINIYYLDISNMTNREYNSMISTIDYFEEHSDWSIPITLIVRNSKTIGVLSGNANNKTMLNFFKNNRIIK